MKKLLILLVVVIFVMMGCSSNSIYITKEYKGKKIKHKNLVIVQLFKSPGVLNPDNVIDGIEIARPEGASLEFFKREFPITIKKNSYFQNVLYKDKKSSMHLSERLLDINEKTQIKILLPEDGSLIKFDNQKVDFILFINDYNITQVSANSDLI